MTEKIKVVPEGLITTERTFMAPIVAKNVGQVALATDLMCQYITEVFKICNELGLPTLDGGYPLDPLDARQFTAAEMRSFMEGVIETLRWVEGTRDSQITYMLEHMNDLGSIEKAARDGIEFTAQHKRVFLGKMSVSEGRIGVKRLSDYSQ